MIKGDLLCRRLLATCFSFRTCISKSRLRSRIDQNFTLKVSDWQSINCQPILAKENQFSEYGWGKKRANAHAHSVSCTSSLCCLEERPRISPRLQSTWNRDISNVGFFPSVSSAFCMQVLIGDVIVQRLRDKYALRAICACIYELARYSDQHCFQHKAPSVTRENTRLGYTINNIFILFLTSQCTLSHTCEFYYANTG